MRFFGQTNETNTEHTEDVNKKVGQILKFCSDNNERNSRKGEGPRSVKMKITGRGKYMGSLREGPVQTIKKNVEKRKLFS